MEDKRHYSENDTDTISAQNTFSTPIYIKGDFNFSLWGTWSATVFVQRSFDEGTTWLDVEELTDNSELIGYEPEGANYRWGIKTGGYTSGDANGRLGQDTTAY